MAFTPKTWADGEAGGTPITAAELNRIEQGIADVELTPGPAGKDGADGAKGDKGDKGEQGPAGKDGADGFPTEAQWDELVSRVDAIAAAQE